MATRTLLAVGAAAALLASACAKHKPVVAPVRIVDTVEVRVPVPVKREPPAELLATYAPATLPEFVAPQDPQASSALTADGERRMRALLNDLLTQLSAWRAWATADDVGLERPKPVGGAP